MRPQVSAFEGNTGTTPFAFVVTRTGNLTGTTTVDWAVSGAANAADFSGAISGSLSFAPTETSKTITLNVIGDLDVEANELFTVTLSNAADNVATNAVDIATAAASSTINNDDVDLAIAASQVSAFEGNTGTLPDAHQAFPLMA